MVRIKKTLHSDSARVYFLFLKAVLPRFTKFNTMFLQERPIIHKLNIEMCNLLRQFLTCFIPFPVLQRSDIITKQVDFRRKNQLSDDGLFIGHKTRLLLETGGSTSSEKEFFVRVRTFFELGTKEMYRLLPFDDDVLKNFKAFRTLQRNLPVAGRR